MCGKWRPILFTGPMVCKILAGEKTQTRRIIKPQPPDKPMQRLTNLANDGTEWGYEGDPGPSRGDITYSSGITEPLRIRTCVILRCPYGRAGDYLWVKERTDVIDRGVPPDGWQPTVVYYADKSERQIEEDGSRKPRVVSSIHMPRRHSRLSLCVTGVCIERLNDISEQDAKAEGCDREFRIVVMRPDKGPDYRIPFSYRGGYANLWDHIHGPGLWDANPWVWAINFERVNEP